MSLTMGYTKGYLTGIKKGLEIKGSQEEQEIVKKMSQIFFVTFSRISKFKKSIYTFAFLKPGEKYNKMFNLHNEILLLFSSYENFDTRTFDFVDKLLSDFHNRLDKICIILVSGDSEIEKKIEKLNNDNKESKIVVPFTYQEILNSESFSIELENKLRKSFYNRDLFALESPLKSENYFFGRSHVVQSFYDKYSLGEHSGLFGLRRIGKTSVLYALERMIALRKGNSVYIDCQDPAVHKSRWFELLYYIVERLKEKYDLKIETNPIENYTEQKASRSFENDLKNIKKALNNYRILLIFDEIENISFKTSSSEHWKNGDDYIYFWQTLRAIHQKNDDLFCFIIAGVNPLCVEQPTVNEYDNPIFSLIKPTYLSLFTLDNVREMISSIGRYMGLHFDQEVYTYLHDDYGGHPFLIRHVCSLINSQINTIRPAIVTKFIYKQNKENYDKQIQDYIKLIIYVLEKWYPEEYRLLQILVSEGNSEFKKEIQNDSKIIEHLKGYGILKEVNGNYFITINALEKYLSEQVQSSKRLLTKEGRWTEISLKRNKLEENLRKLISVTLQTQLGVKETKKRILDIKPEKERDRLQSYSLDIIFKDHLYFLDLKTIICKNWEMFEKLFNDKKKFEIYMDFINTHRVDAHSKDISDEDLGILLIAFKWFEEKLSDLPF